MIYWSLCILLIFCAFCGFTNNYGRTKHMIWSMFVIFTLFQGLRWNTGADWQQYLRVFQTCDWKHIFTFDRGDGSRYMEFGYIFLNVVIKTIFKEYTFFLLITCGFINLMYMRILKKYIPHKYQSIAYALFLMMSAIFPVRQALACSFFIGFGIPALLEKNWKIYISVVAACCTIHYSCLILIVFYYIDKFIKTPILLVVFLSSSIIVGFLPSIMEKVVQLPIIRDLAFASLVDRYQNTDTLVEKTGLNNSLTIMFVIIQILFFDYMREKFKSDAQKYKLLTTCLNMFVVTSTCRQISLYPGLNEFARFGYYVGIGYLILVAYTFYFLYEKYKNFSVIISLVFIAFMCFKVDALFKDLYADLFIPYYSVFENSPQRDVWVFF